MDAPADSMHDEPKIRHATVEQGNLLHRLGIALDEPWVGISTDGPVSAQHARWRIDTGTEELYDPLPESTREQWDGFGHDAVGLRLTSPPDVLQLWDVRDSDGPVQEWADGLYLRVRYQRIRYQQSVLFAELTYDDQGRADLGVLADGAAGPCLEDVRPRPGRQGSVQVEDDARPEGRPRRGHVGPRAVEPEPNPGRRRTGPVGHPDREVEGRCGRPGRGRDRPRLDRDPATALRLDTRRQPEQSDAEPAHRCQDGDAHGACSGMGAASRYRIPGHEMTIDTALRAVRGPNVEPTRYFRHGHRQPFVPYTSLVTCPYQAGPCPIRLTATRAPWPSQTRTRSGAGSWSCWALPSRS